MLIDFITVKKLFYVCPQSKWLLCFYSSHPLVLTTTGKNIKSQYCWFFTVSYVLLTNLLEMLDFNAKIQYYYCLTFKYRWGVQNHSGLTHQNFRFNVIVPFNLNLDHLFDGKVVQPWKEMRDSLAPSEHWTTVTFLTTLCGTMG